MTAGAFRYKCAPVHLRYMREQVWECRNDVGIYSALSEFEHAQIADYVPEFRKVLDLGCGLGRAAIYLNGVFQDPETHYILADTTGSRGEAGGWDPLGEKSYNDLKLTASFARLNGLTNFRTFDYLLDDWNELTDVDFVTSRCAFGMHIPIEAVMPQLLQVSTSDVTMIFGTRRRDLYGPNSFQDLFRDVLFLPQEETPPFPHQDWLILWGRR